MPTIHDSYVGFAEETTYATGVAPTRFLEFASESLSGKYERITAEGLRAGSRVARSDRFVINPKGAEGNIKTEVLDKGFGLLFKHMLGSVATTGTNPNYTHTATSGGLLGDSLTFQVGRCSNDGTLHPFTYAGCKIKDWELSVAVDGLLMLDLGIDASSEFVGVGAGANALSTPTYPTGAQLFSWNNGTVTIGGSSFLISDLSIKGDNGLNTDRYVLGTGAKRQPLEEGMRQVEFEVKAEFDNLAQYQRVSSSTRAGALAAIVGTFTAPSGGTLTVTMPFARFDEGSVNVDGAKIMEQTMKGMAMTDGSSSEITIAYATSDATP